MNIYKYSAIKLYSSSYLDGSINDIVIVIMPSSIQFTYDILLTFMSR